MSKNKEEILDTHIEDEQEFVDIMKSRIHEYSLATFDRAFPYYADGLKPVIKRILYTMWSEKLTYFKKVYYTMGLTAGKYHPYADAAIYGAIVLLGQKFTTNYPFIDTQGNFGSEEGDPAAAPRYIECKLSKFAQDIITDEIDAYSIDYTDNYDWTLKEPVYLPTKIPLVLVQGTFGIGEAYIVKIPSHNLTDVVNMCIQYINNKSISNKQLVKDVYPDFPTGGIITNIDDVKKYYESSVEELEQMAKEGKTLNMKYCGRAYIDRENSAIVIQELPYGVTFRKIIEKITEERNNKKGIGSVFENVINFGNKQQPDGSIWYEIICKKDCNLVDVMNALYDRTPLKKSVPLSFIVNFGKSVRKMTIKDIIEEWYKVRVKTKRRKYTYEHSDLKNRVHILEGLSIVYVYKKEIIDLISKSNDKEDLIKNLVKVYKLSQVQARGICDMPIHTLTKLSRDKLEKEIIEKNNRIIALEANLSSIDSIIINELEEVGKKYGRPRRTTIGELETQSSESLSFNQGALLYSHDSIALFDNKNVINRKVILNGLCAVKIDGKNVKEIIGCYQIDKELEGLAVFNTDGTVKRISMSDIQVLNNWITINKPENLISKIVPIYNEKNASIVVLSDDMKIRRFNVDEISSSRDTKCGKVIAANYVSDKHKGVLFVSKNSKYLYLELDEIPSLSKSSLGNMTGLEKDLFVGSCAVKETDIVLISLTDNVSGYVTALGQEFFKPGRRTTKGNKLFDLKSFNVIGVDVIDTSKDPQMILCVGRNGVTSLSAKSIKSGMTPKKIGLNWFGVIGISN